MKLMNNELSIIEEKNMKNTLLYINDVEINEQSYETKILLEENIENIIKFQIVYDAEKVNLKYDVSNTISYYEYLKYKKLNKEDISRMILAIDDILSSIENYLLSENSISLNLKLIRVEKNKKGKVNYKFIAIPNNCSDFSNELSKFLIRILRMVDVDDKDALALAYGLFVRSSKDNYTMDDLLELVEKYYDKNANNEISIDDFITYDEEIAKDIKEEYHEEISESIMEEETINNTDTYDCSSNTLTSKDEGKIFIDNTTRDVLGESILNDFDNDDKKVQNVGKKIFGNKSKQTLKGHISVGLIGFIVAPIVLIAIPIFYYFLYM